MPIIDNSINKFINDSLVAENDAREHEHESSGKLSASMLYQPVRFQLLKTIGAPKRALDPYVLGKFARGNQVEDWFVDRLEKMGLLLGKQVKLEYRDCIGFADSEVDSDKMYCKKGELFIECKSVTNMKLKRIAATEVDYHYRMQSCYYAMARGHSHYAVAILSGEDLQVTIYIFPVEDMKADVDRAIDAYQTALKDWNEKKILPKFAANPKVPWTASLQYAMFDEFYATAPDDQVIKKLTELGLVK